MSAKAENKRKYSDPNVRMRKVNHTALVAITIIELFLIFALFVQTFAVKTSYGKLGIIPALILLIGMIVNWIVYNKNKSSEKLRYIMFISMAIGWVYLMVSGENLLVTFYIYPVSLATILYHDKKFEKISFITNLCSNILRFIIWTAKGVMFETSGQKLICMIVNLEILLVLHIIAKLSEQFTCDMMQSVKNEQNLQEKMVQDILRVSDSVKTEVIETNQLMKNLQESSNIVYSSVKEIAERTQETVLSVQEQSKMTEMIDQSISETANHAKVMVQAAEDSKKMMTQGMESIYNIKESAEEISKTNSHVAETMSELQGKSKEVQQITEVIFSISSQTNLLALNASIESARAGEAGRGFAVVADQIRSLSEETRQSTEKIAGIVEELVHHAQDATSIVSNSIEAMNRQNHMVENVADNFGTIRDNIDILSKSVEDINIKIENLVDSNNVIINNIRQLSVSSEEMSNSAKEVESRSSANQEEAEKAKQILLEVSSLVEEFEKYKA